MPDADPRLVHLPILAHVLDRAFRVPGTRWRLVVDALLGIVPGLGDVLGSVIGAYGFLIARQIGAPSSIQLRMLLNLSVDAVVGVVPLFGDLFDFAFKANTRNLALLDQWLSKPHATHRSSIVVLVMALLVLAAILGGAIWVALMSVAWLVHALAPS